MQRPGVGIKAIFALVGSMVASSIYFSLGVVTDSGRQWTPLIFLIAGIFFLLAAMTYAEGASLYRQRGGSTVLARYAFGNELISFAVGWVILIDYLILLALCAFTAVNYAAAFWPVLGGGTPEIVAAVGVVVYVTVINIFGMSVRWLPRISLLVALDLLLQFVVIICGLALVFSPELLLNPVTTVNPGISDVIFALIIATVAFPGIEAASGFSTEVDNRSPWYKRMIGMGAVSVLFTYVSFGLIAATGLPLADRPGTTQGDSIQTPVLSVIDRFGSGLAVDVVGYVVAAVATLLLIFAANATMLGLSRISYSLAVNSQLPRALSRLHPRHATPYVTILFAGVIACLMLIPADLDMLIGVYAFGAMFAAAVAHSSICLLRYRQPDRQRLFKVPLSIKIGGGELPIPSLIGAIGSAFAWGWIVVVHEPARLFGASWLLFGLAVYFAYRKRSGRPLTKRLELPEAALRGSAKEAEYGSILVPVLGTPLDDDIMQTAGRLAAELDDKSEAITIQAVWVFELPIALPLDAELPQEKLTRAQQALDRSKAIGEEYSGVKVNIKTLRSRRAGRAIVEEAAAIKAEVIVMAAEEQSRIGGGALLGSIGTQRDNFVGEVTKYVINKAPCRVILTAPAADSSAATEKTVSPSRS